ncbi:MAG: S8 family serine peptidase [Holophagales bacterium]|nr:S8 family serine peptidase [Holophagales bacterium]MYC11817.1 S8 family serine peptidase [Holophagales bacterium]
MNRHALALAVFCLAVPVAVYGQTAPTASVFEGDEALTVHWPDPGDATLNSAYDVEYILTSDLEGGTWATLSNVAKGKGGHYSILRNLTNDAEYSLRVKHRDTTDLSGSTYRITGLTIDNPGSGYMGTVTYTISGEGGPTHEITAQTPGGTITDLTLTNSGSGYTETPTVTISSPGDSGTTATAEAVLDGGVDGIAVTAGGTGYTSAPTVEITGGGGSGATAEATVGGSVAAVNVTSQGSGYTSAPTVSFSGGGGSGAEATASVGGVVTGLTLTQTGAYPSGQTPAITLVSHGNGSGATAEVTALEPVTDSVLSVASITVTNGGSGYTSEPTVTISAWSGFVSTGGGTEAVLTATVSNGEVTGVTVTDGGFGYTPTYYDSDRGGFHPRTVVFSGGDGSGAEATIEWSTNAFGVAAVALTNPGSGYDSNSYVHATFDDPSSFGNRSGSMVRGATAAADVAISSGGLSVTVTNGGTGYTSAPTVTISGGGGSGAAAEALMGGGVTGVTVTNAGSGYTRGPLVSFTGGGGSGATATASVSAHLAGLTLTDAGSGYTSAPTVAISGGGGSGATATATLGADVLPEVELESDVTDSSYTAEPTISVSGTGTGGSVSLTTETVLAGATSDTITGTPAEVGGNGSASNLELEVVAAGVLATGDSDSWNMDYVPTGTRRQTVSCYVYMPSGNVDVSYTSQGDNLSHTFTPLLHRYVMRSNTSRRYDLSNTGSSTVEYEVKCQENSEADTRNEALVMDLRYPVDVEYQATGDYYYRSFRITEDGKYGITTGGILDPVLTLYDSSGNRIIRNDDGHQLGNITNPIILADLTVDSGATDPGLFYLHVWFPWNTSERTPSEDRSIPIFVTPVGSAGTSVSPAPVTGLGTIAMTKTEVYMDTWRSASLDPTYGYLESGEEDYWSFNVSPALSGDTHGWVIVRAVGETDSELTGEIVDHTGDGAYRRTIQLKTGRTVVDSNGRVTEYSTSGDYSQFTAMAKLPVGDHKVKLSATNPTTYSISVARDAEAETFDFRADATNSPLGQSCGSGFSEGLTVSDPLSKCQWYLVGNSNVDLGIERAWESGHTGDGVEVAIVDAGVDLLHPDLAPNVVEGKSMDLITGDDDPFEQVDAHGNNVAGIIVADDDDHGIRGIAHDAGFYSFNLLEAFTYANEGRSMRSHIETRGVSNHSIGPPDTGRFWSSSYTWKKAMDNLVKNGFGGLGTVYVNSAGNGGVHGVRGAVEYEYTTHDEYNSHIGAIPVCAVNGDGLGIPRISEMGTNLWVCGLSRGDSHAGIFTTSQYGRYRYGFGGTSAATPTVSGVVALLRDAYPDLSYRDIKLILAESAAKPEHTIVTPSNNPVWPQPTKDYVNNGASMYGGTTGTYTYSQRYGFGLVDVEAALELASGWTRLPKLKMAEACAKMSNPNLTTRYFRGHNELVIEDSGIDFVEYVEFFFDVDFENDQNIRLWGGGPNSVNGQEGNWVILLRGPGEQYMADGGPVDRVIRFADNQYLGTAADGTWKITVKETNGGWRYPAANKYGQGKLYAYGVRIYGHGPTSETATAGNSGSDVVDYSYGTFPCSRAEEELTSREFTVEEVTASVNENETWTSGAPTLGGDEVNGDVTWSVENDDAAIFSVDSGTGVLTLSPRDFENPADTNADNVYTTVLRATDAVGTTGTGHVAVTILDVGAPGNPNDTTPVTPGLGGGTCAASSTHMCLQNGRFEAYVEYARSDISDAARSSAEVSVAKEGSGIFSFSRRSSHRNEWSLLLQVLDACQASGGIRVTASEIRTTPYSRNSFDTSKSNKRSDVALSKEEFPEWTLELVDKVTGNITEISGPRRGDGLRLQSPAHIEHHVWPEICADSSATASMPVKAPTATERFSGVSSASSDLESVSLASSACLSNSRAACLHNTFSVIADWHSGYKTPRSNGKPQRIPMKVLESSDSGAAFGTQNAEIIDLIVKVSDHCNAPGDDRRGYFVDVAGPVSPYLRIHGFTVRTKDTRNNKSSWWLWYPSDGDYVPSEVTIEGSASVRFDSGERTNRVLCQ